MAGNYSLGGRKSFYLGVQTWQVILVPGAGNNIVWEFDNGR